MITRFFPSQIIEYIDRKYPHAIKDNKEHIGIDHLPTLSILVTMLEGIPQHIINLQGNEFTDYIETVEAIRTTVNAWKRGDAHYKLEGAPGLRKKCPIAVIRQKLGTMQDEGIEPGTTDLLFIIDDGFRNLLRQDITVMNNAFNNGEWKAATVLAGSVIEALLLYKIKIIDNLQLIKVRDQVKLDNPNIDIPNNVDKYRLSHLIPIAIGLNIIDKDPTGVQCDIARNFRNLIHPGQAIRTAQACDRGTALSALAAVEHVLRNLS